MKLQPFFLLLLLLHKHYTVGGGGGGDNVVWFSGFEGKKNVVLAF